MDLSHNFFSTNDLFSKVSSQKKTSTQYFVADTGRTGVKQRQKCLNAYSIAKVSVELVSVVALYSYLEEIQYYLYVTSKTDLFFTSFSNLYFTSPTHSAHAFICILFPKWQVLIERWIIRNGLFKIYLLVPPLKL